MLNGHPLNGAALNGSAGVNAINADVSLIQPTASLFHNWTASLDATAPDRYVCDLVGVSTVRVPVSSWQATVQSGRQSYVQAVVPAAQNYADQINAAYPGEIVIRRVSQTKRGETVEQEMARGTITDIRFDRGPQRYSCTLSGYGAAVAASAPESVTLSGVRSVSSQLASYRARAKIDWFLRPGYTVTASDVSFTAAYINYFVNVTDAYMDVGSRAA